MMFKKCTCSVCDRDLYDGESVYHIHDDLICENCISEFIEIYESDDGVDDAVDELKDLRNGW